jgi:hypothetical protein
MAVKLISLASMGEQGVEGNMWTQDRETNRRLGKIK